MSRKRRKEARRKSSGLLAAAILFVFVFEHFFAPFSYATSPDMASASDAVRSGKVALTNAPEEDVQIAVISGDVDSTSGYSAGQQVCLDVYIKNNTADTITDGFLKYAGRGIEKDRESTYFELIEGAVRDSVPGEGEDAGEDLPGETEERDQDTGDQDLDTGDRDPDTEERDLDKPDVLEDLVLSPGQSCHVGFYYTIKEDLRGTKDQSIEFTFGWDEDGGTRTCKQTFRYVVGAMNLLPVEIAGSGQTAWGAAQIHAGEAGEMFLDFDLGEVWDVIDERLEEESSREDEDIPADTTVDGDGAADTDEETGKAEDAGEADRGDKEGDIVKDESGENADTAGGVQGDEGRQDVSLGGGTQGETAGAETGTSDGDDAGEAGQSKDADQSVGASQSEDAGAAGHGQDGGSGNSGSGADGAAAGLGDDSAHGGEATAGQNDGAGEQEPVLQIGEPRDIPLVREPLETELDVLAADEKADAPEGTDDTGTKESADLAGEQPAVPPVAEDGQVVLPPDAGEEQAAEPSTGESEPVPVPPAADEGQTAEPPTGESEPVPVPPAADEGQTAEPPIAESEPVPVPPAVEGGQTVVPPAAEGEQIVAAPTATPSTSVPRPDDGLGGLIKWEDDAVAGSEKPVIQGIRCDVEAYGIKLDAFKVAEEEEGEEDGQSTSVRCTFRVNGEVKPGTYYGTVKAAYAFKGRTFHSTQGFIIVVPEIEDEEVAEVIRLIDALPEQDEVEETFAAYDLAEDEDGRDAYYMELYTQVMEAYRKYMALSSEQQEKVYNRDKLMAYEWLWGGAMLAVGDEVTDWNGLKTAIKSQASVITIILGKDFDNRLNGTYDTEIIEITNKTVILNLHGHTLACGASNRQNIFLVKDNGVLKIVDDQDSEGSITYQNVDNLIRVEKDGKLIIEKGKIERKAHSNRAIISVEGTIEIVGGMICSEKNILPDDYGNGGAILAINNSSIEMSGGSICDHKVRGSGGGIYARNSKIEITGGDISNNTSLEDGGGIAIGYASTDTGKGKTITVSGNTTIENNVAGDILNKDLEIVVKDSEIPDAEKESVHRYNRNDKRGSGGGIYIDAQSQSPLMIKDDVCISGNYAYAKTDDRSTNSRGGGGICTGGNLTLEGGTIRDNYAEESGGGILLYRPSGLPVAPPAPELVMSGGSIEYNTAQKSEGGGIRLQGKGTITGGSITNNTTNTTYDFGGGGIFIETDASLKILNAKITSNTAHSFGGGVAGCGKSSIYALSIKGSAIYDNDALGQYTSKNTADGDEKVYGKDWELKSPAEQQASLETFKKESEGSLDYFCSGRSIVFDYMLGGGHSNWKGVKEGELITIAPNGFAETAAESDFTDNGPNRPAPNGLMGLTARPSDADKVRAGSVGDLVIISGNTSKTNGGGIGCNGTITFGEDGITTDWVPKAVKYVEQDGQPIKPQDTFDFVLVKEFDRESFAYNEADVVGTASNDAKGDIQFAFMLDKAFSPDQQVGEKHPYTFYMLEAAGADSDKYQYDNRVYKIDMTVDKVQINESDQGWGDRDGVKPPVLYQYKVDPNEIKVTVLDLNGKEHPWEGEITFTNRIISPPSPPSDGGGNGGGGGDEPPTPTQPVPPPENPPIIPSDDRGNGSVVEIVEEEINVPIFALPDAELPEMPEQITLFEGGVPRGYRRVWNPDTQQWEWIPEDEIPLTGLAKTGDDSHPMLWIALFLGSIVGIVTLVVLRRKSVQEMKAEGRKQSGSGS